MKIRKTVILFVCIIVVLAIILTELSKKLFPKKNTLVDNNYASALQDEIEITIDNEVADLAKKHGVSFSPELLNNIRIGSQNIINKNSIFDQFGNLGIVKKMIIREDNLYNLRIYGASKHVYISVTLVYNEQSRELCIYSIEPGRH